MVATNLNEGAATAAVGGSSLTSANEIIPLDAEMIQFLLTMENSQEFYSNIVNRYEMSAKLTERGLIKLKFFAPAR